jgi:hypothetical protein
MSRSSFGGRVLMVRCPLQRCKVMRNALDPDLMTAAERLVEIGEILAAGLLRLRARERESATRGRAKTMGVCGSCKQPPRRQGTS